MGTAPEVITKLTGKTATTPDTVTFECKIDAGDPPSTIHWYKDCKEVYQGSKYDLRYKNNVATLIISDTESLDASMYRCEAANKIGRVQTEATLNINGQYTNIAYLICLVQNRSCNCVM